MPVSELEKNIQQSRECCSHCVLAEAASKATAATRRQQGIHTFNSGTLI